MNTDELCSICGEGHVTNHVDQLESEYRGKTALVPMHYKTCNVCGSDFAGGDESRLNKRAMLAFRKSVDGLLTGAEICALRERYEINQKQASRLFGGGPVAFSKYENDDVAHSESMDKLLRLVLKSEHAFWSLVEQAGMTAELAPKVPAQIAKLAAETLQDNRASQIAKSLAASALAQRGGGKQTGAEMEDKAARVLASDRYSAGTRQLAASVLAQANKER